MDSRGCSGWVYSLDCPLTGKPRYIGCTIYDHPMSRIGGHAARGSNMKSPVSLWVQQQRMAGRVIPVRTHGRYHPYGHASAVEHDLIKTLSKFLGPQILNCIGRGDMKSRDAGPFLRRRLAEEAPLPPGYRPCPDMGVRYHAKTVGKVDLPPARCMWQNPPDWFEDEWQASRSKPPSRITCSIAANQSA